MTQLRKLDENEIAECEMMCGMLWITDDSPTVFMCVLHEGHEDMCIPQNAVGSYRPKPKLVK